MRNWLGAALLLALVGCGGEVSQEAGESAAGSQASPDPNAASGTSAPDPRAWFQDVAVASGVDFVHESGHRDRPYFPEIMGPGVALLDIDSDGALDIYQVQSGSLYEPGGPAAANRVYRNRGDGTFEDVTDSSGAADDGYGMGVAAGDIDGDGDTDLYVTNLGPNVMYRNDGGGRFTDVTEASRTGDPGWGVSTAFADLDADGDLDLFVTNYVNWAFETELDCPGEFEQLDYCLPTSYEAPGRDTLYRNDGGGVFTEVTEEAGLAQAFGYGLGTCIVDFDGDGRLDVFVANDTVFNQLWINQGDFRFEDEALVRGCAVDEDGVAKAGMGIMAIDYDDDADRDILVVNLVAQSDSYYENDSGFFFDRSIAVGLGAVSRPYTRFGVGFADFNCDGWLDLYEANGRVVRASGWNGPGDAYAEPNVLLRGGPDRKFQLVEPAAGTVEDEVYTSRAAAFGDLDGDGYLDVVVTNRDGPTQLFRNVVANRGNWIALRPLERTGGNALNAVVTLQLGDRTITRDCLSGYSYLAASDPTVRVGLGEASVAEAVTVRWVDGEAETFGSLEAGAVHVLRRGEGQPAS